MRTGSATRPAPLGVEFREVRFAISVGTGKLERMIPGVAYTKGRLLVATPPLDDPNFDRTVVYMIEHDDDGAVGVVLNRPSGIELPDVLDRWRDRLAQPACLYEGGPVETEALIALARRQGDVEDDEHQVAITDNLSSVDLSSDPALVTTAVDIRVFQGYSGWGPGQLDLEMAAGGWLVLDADDDDLFSSEPDTLWRRVLSRQPGRLAWLAEAPEDLSSN
jgi:putative transcriptional regulator